ncbi:kinase-like protein [Nocardiopsis rhodophaea]|uniref:kinase-like protein n=1 Tax=Nocardiopsis rhodophaea TaxID=280238 RepID=UPI0031E24853
MAAPSSGRSRVRAQDRADPGAPLSPRQAEGHLRAAVHRAADAPATEALSALLAPRSAHALRRLHDAERSDRFEGAARLYRTAVDACLAPVLSGIAGGRPAGRAEIALLTAAVHGDPLQAAFAPPGGHADSGRAALERVRLLRGAWPTFADWWRGYFPGAEGPPPPVADLWRLHLPFCQWIVRERERRRPGGMLLVGFNGSPGAGKTVLTNALAAVLNTVLDPEADGRAVACSGDDWYLPRADREALKAHGYDPGAPGVSNRGAPGTHDMAWLARNLREMENSTPRSRIALARFDKRTDDRPAGAAGRREVRGKVAVCLFDLWYAGARTGADPALMPPGLQRGAAAALREWAPVFARMDALWGFDWPPYERMLREREEQEALTALRRGAPGMSTRAVHAFMDYLVRRTWDWRSTSPVPPDASVTFRAWRDVEHRVIAVHRGQGRGEV